jgi:hypothetical protein
VNYIFYYILYLNTIWQKIYKISLVEYISYILWCHLDLPFFFLSNLFVLQGQWQLLCLCTGLSDCTLVRKNSINWYALKTLSKKTAVAQSLNNKLNIYQQKYNTICEAGATLVLFNVQSHPDILYGNWCLDTCKFCEAYFISNKYFIFTLLTIRVLVTEHKGHVFMFILSILINFKFCCLLCMVCDLYCFSIHMTVLGLLCTSARTTATGWKPNCSK